VSDPHRARKRFGQHFLIDDGVVARTVRAARIQPGDRVLEIGPGQGVLTRALLDTGADLTAIELDRDLIANLRDRFPNLRLVEGDALSVDWSVLCPGAGWKVVANLPYNVGTHVTMALLREPATFSSVTVMLQKEVVDRLCAEPGTHAYGALTVESRARAVPTFQLRVGPEKFRPRPKVESAVVRFDLRPTPDTGGTDPDLFDRVVRVAFAYRRKTLLNSLSASYGRERSAAALSAAGIDPGLRAERLTLPDYQRLARSLAVG
jgi:16S rRNA (adenine1518-N6/adenine1519-N6)-dimethyltransferase